MDHYITAVRPGTIIFEMSGVPEDQAREAMRYGLTASCPSKPSLSPKRRPMTYKDIQAKRPEDLQKLLAEKRESCASCDSRSRPTSSSKCTRCVR